MFRHKSADKDTTDLSGIYHRVLCFLFSIVLITFSSISKSETVKIIQKGGTFTVPVILNEKLELGFIIDSGASEITVPDDVIVTLLRTGTITKNDFLAPATFTLANGSTVTHERISLRSVRVGNTVLNNVTVAITNRKGALLLGQSFLSLLPSWKIDNVASTLIIGKDGSSENVPQTSEGQTVDKPGFDDARGVCLPNCSVLPRDKQLYCLQACVSERKRIGSLKHSPTK